MTITTNDLCAALIEARRAINSMKVEAETAGAGGDEQMLQEACETISNESLTASMAIDVALAAPQPPQIAEPESEPMLRFCPGCGSCGPVPAKFRDCCPDGGDSRVIPASLANKCRDLFRLAVAKATTKEPS